MCSRFFRVGPNNMPLTDEMVSIIPPMASQEPHPYLKGEASVKRKGVAEELLGVMSDQLRWRTSLATNIIYIYKG